MKGEEGGVGVVGDEGRGEGQSNGVLKDIKEKNEGHVIITWYW